MKHYDIEKMRELVKEQPSYHEEMEEIEKDERIIDAATALLEACILAASSDSFIRLNTAAQRAIREAIKKATE